MPCRPWIPPARDCFQAVGCARGLSIWPSSIQGAVQFGKPIGQFSGNQLDAWRIWPRRSKRPAP